jgi:hypothetical protein
MVGVHSIKIHVGGGGWGRRVKRYCKLKYIYFPNAFFAILHTTLALFTTDKYNIAHNLSLCLAKHHAMKAYWGNEGMAPCIL